MRGRGRNNDRGDNHSRGKRGRNRRRGGYNNNRGGQGNRRDPRAAATSGNKRERIAVESGFLVLIDQFMLANPQFVQQLLERIDDEPEAKDELIRKYGGAVIEVGVGTYRIKRDPYAYTIVIHQSNVSDSKEELMETAPMELCLDVSEAPEEGFVPVRFQSRITELGMLELWCKSSRNEEAWKLEFNVRENSEAAGT